MACYWVATLEAEDAVRKAVVKIDMLSRSDGVVLNFSSLDPVDRNHSV